MQLTMNLDVHRQGVIMNIRAFHTTNVIPSTAYGLDTNEFCHAKPIHQQTSENSISNSVKLLWQQSWLEDMSDQLIN